MIGYLRGKIVTIEDEGLLLDVRGVGYDVTCTSNTLSALQEGQLVQLWIHTHVREDSFHLFGFDSKIEKQLFLSLIKVNGIGPKLAVKALSALPTETVVTMIEAGDVKGLTSLPKIGKKTAEQIILTLKGKLVFAEEGHRGQLFLAKDDIKSALVNLGFKVSEVDKVVTEMNPSMDLQEGIRSGLAALTS